MFNKLVRLHENWDRIILKAWSVRFTALAVVAEIINQAFPYLDGYLPIPQPVFGLLVGLFGGLAIYARCVPQKGL